jgi:hypothetical protein
MAILKNFLPEQYLRDSEIEINHNYLAYQFSDHDEIWEKIREVVLRGDFTLGKDVDNLEVEFASFVESKYAVGVGSGTDALFLSLKAVGVGEGDEVITSPFTFYATVGAIVTAGAKPIFCDIESQELRQLCLYIGLEGLVKLRQLVASRKNIISPSFMMHAMQLAQDITEVVLEKWGLPPATVFTL